MKGLLLKGLAAAAVAAAIAVPAASAKSSAVKLSIIPLQKAQLGSAAKSLSLDPDSGVIINAEAARVSFTASSDKTLTKLGRITGYGLDYGAGASGGSGVTEIWTGVDEYKTAADAKKGLAFWKKDDAWVSHLDQGGFSVNRSYVKVKALGSSRFANLVSYSAANIVPVDTVDEQFTDGRYVLDVSVWASTGQIAQSEAGTLAKKLDARLHAGLAGTLHAAPAKLPKQTAGAPSGGPDLSALALKTTDLTGTATVKSQGYYVDPASLADYSVFMLPAGPFDLLDQEIEWYPTANQASFAADWASAVFLASGGSPVDVSANGDGAQAAMSNSQGGFGVIVFSTGHLAEFINVGSRSSVQAADLQNLAHTAAGYINNAGLGS